MQQKIEKQLEEFKLLMEKKLEESIKENMEQTKCLIGTTIDRTEKIIEKNNEEFRKEIYTNIQTNNDKMNNNMDRLTMMFTYMQENQERCNNNLMHLMNHIGVNNNPETNKDNMENSMEIVFDKNCQTPTKDPFNDASTICTTQSQHRYNTRSKGSVSISNTLESIQGNQSNASAIGIN